MNKSVVAILSTTALLCATERSIPVTNQLVDSDKAKFSLWEHSGYVNVFKKHVATEEILSSPARRYKKRYFVDPLSKIPAVTPPASDWY